MTRGQRDHTDPRLPALMASRTLHGQPVTRSADDLVYVAVTAEGVHVGDADDCTSLDIRMAPGSRSSLDEALRRSGLGAWEGGTEASLNVAELRSLAAAEEVSHDWLQRWEAMIAYARRKGWLSPDGITVRAHVVDLPG